MIRVAERRSSDSYSILFWSFIIIVTQYILINEYNEIADLNEDGSVNIQDIIILVGIITG